LAVVVEFDRDRRELQQRVPVPVETTGLDVDHDRQVAAETLGHAPEGGVCGVAAGFWWGHRGIVPRPLASIARKARSYCVAVSSRLSRGGRPSPPWTRNQTFSAMLVAWSPMRSMFLAMNNR